MIDPSRRDAPRLSPRALGVIALTIVTAVVAFSSFRGRSNDGVSTETTSESSVESEVTSTPTTATKPGPATVPDAPTTTAVAAPKPLPPGGLFAGGRPPQFVLVSFDGAADDKLLARWMETTKKANAHMTLFLSAVYLLGDENSAQYKGPRHAAGASAIKFAPTQGETTAAFLAKTIGGLKNAQEQGHQLENHFGGHWCGPDGVQSWSAKDWAEELNQFEKLVNNVDTLNKLTTPVGSPFLRQPVGARTPCLEGNLKLLYPVLRARGYRYDASGTRTLDAWPDKTQGLWTYGFPTTKIEGVNRSVLTVDFSWRETLDPKYDASPEQAKVISEKVYQGLMSGFTAASISNRAPFELANHFVSFTHDAYNQAVERFLVDVCNRQEVFCVNYREMTDWLDAHADKLASFRAGSFTKAAA